MDNKKTSKTTSKKATKAASKAATKKKVSRATEAKKVTTRKRVSRKVTEKKLKKPISKSKVPKIQAKVADEVTLPTNMSIRAVEKTTTLETELDAYIRASVSRIARVSGFCFALIGMSLTAGTLLPDVNQLSLTGATINSASAEVIEEVDTASEFKVISKIPDSMVEEETIKFTLTNVSKVDVILVNVEQKGFYNIETEELLEDKYRSTIPAQSLKDGYYRIKIYATNSFGGGSKAFESKIFTVGEPDHKLIQEPVTKPVNEEPKSIPENSFSIFHSQGDTLSGVASIGLLSPDGLDYIELYARPVSSLESRFIVVAQKRLGQFGFYFDTSNIPNGKYEFYAKSKVSGGTLTSNKIQLSVANNSSMGLSGESTATKVVRPIITIEETNYEPTYVLNEDVARETDSLIEDNREELNELIKLYSIAKQSGNELMIEEARDALNEKRESIVFDAMQEQSTRDIAADINVELEGVIDDLKQKADYFEQLRSDRSKGKTAEDTDQDGVSDFDEINIYNTDPESSDTDNDGVIDSVELMKGFDPLDSSSEAVIKFDNPTETVGLVRDDILKVESMTPIVDIEGEENAGVIKADIVGKALPNSFVTLYVFSTPTVVTVRTDADGSFEYTFNKELEDGTHQVFVAITDNTGDIIAQSNPFTFVKEAQAFTPVDADKADMAPIVSVTETMSKDTVNVVAMGILALGLILIMLGVGLRSKTVVITETSEGN